MNDPLDNLLALISYALIITTIILLVAAATR